jgi:hypothetical protein
VCNLQLKEIEAITFYRKIIGVVQFFYWH